MMLLLKDILTTVVKVACGAIVHMNGSSLSQVDVGIGEELWVDSGCLWVVELTAFGNTVHVKGGGC